MTIGCAVRKASPSATFRARIDGAVIRLPGTGEGVARLVPLSMVKVDMAAASSGRREAKPARALLRDSEALLPLRAFGQRDGIEHGRALVAQDGERAADRAGRLVVAVAARRVEVDTGAGDERDRTFHGADDLAERNLARRTRQLVAALRAASALHEARLLQVEHDQLEIFGRDPLRFRDPRELHRGARLGFGEEEQRAKRVAGLLGDHRLY